MRTLESTHVCSVPITRIAAGFPPDRDRGTALLLDTRDFTNRAVLKGYQRLGYVHEGVRITTCDQELFDLLDAMGVPWSPWPEELVACPGLLSLPVGNAFPLRARGACR